MLFGKNKEVKIYCERGFSLVAEEKFLEALSEFEKAYELSPRSVIANEGMGKVLYVLEHEQKARKQRARKQRAFEFLKNASNLNSKDSSIYLFLGYIYHNKHEYEKAVLNYEKTIFLDSKDELAHFNLSFCYYVIHEYQKAIISCETTLKFTSLSTENRKALEELLAYLKRQKNIRNEYWDFLLQSDMELAVSHRAGEITAELKTTVIDRHELWVKEYASRWNCDELEAWDRWKMMKRKSEMLNYMKDYSEFY